MNAKDIQRAIDETKTWRDCDEKTMRLKALYSMRSRRLGQVEFDPKIWLDTCDMTTPTHSNKAWHLFGFHKWLHYDDNNVFDGTRRICLICGLVESSPMNRIYAVYESCGYAEINLEMLLNFIKEHQAKIDDKLEWRST